MGGVLRSRVQRAFDNFGHLLIRGSARAPKVPFVCEALNPIPHETPAPISNCMFMHAKLRRHCLARQNFAAQHDHATTIRQ